MIYKMYSVYDIKADAFAPPFFLARDEVAVRTFGDALRDPTHPMAAHPDDYVLMRLGDFDDETGTVGAEKAPVRIMTGKGEVV